MAGHRIPFNKPHFFGNEIHYIQQALANGHISGNGPFTNKCEEWLKDRLQVKKSLLTTSCTDALEMCALLLELEPGDEIIMPSFTFVSTANAFVLHGGIPVFADIRPDTLNIDHEQIESLITPRTRAVVVVHYAGVACEMDTIIEIAQRHGLIVIEDNAHGFLGSYKGRPLGSIGNLATLSFHETKNITCGEGGALLIKDSKYSDRAEILRDKGTNRARFISGEVDKYTWVDKGSSFLPSDLLAGVLLAQLQHESEIQERRSRIWKTYESSLWQWAKPIGIQLPTVPDNCEQAYHLFYLLMPDPESRTELIQHLAGHGIHGVFHYSPLNTAPMASHWSPQPSCPVSESVADRLVRLPIYFELSEEDQNSIVRCIQEFKC